MKREIRIYEIPGAEMWRQLFMSHPDENYKKMGEMIYFCKTYDEWNNLTLEMAEQGGWAQMASFMLDSEIQDGRKLHPQGRGFWESKEMISEWRCFRQIINSKLLQSSCSFWKYMAHPLYFTLHPLN